MNTTERHFHHFAQVLHRRKRLLSKCIKIRVTRWSSMWALLFHPSLASIILLNQDNELCEKTEGKTQLTYPLGGHPKRNFTVVHVNFLIYFLYHQRRSCRHRRCHRHRGKPWSRRRSGHVHLTWSSGGTACRQRWAVSSQTQVLIGWDMQSDCREYSLDTSQLRHKQAVFFS